jgi:prevent-host-death family protein
LQTRPDQTILGRIKQGAREIYVTNISEAKANLSQLVEKVLEGEEVIIGKAGKPVAKLVPYHHDSSPRDLHQGIWQNQVWMAEDCDGLPEDIMQAFTGETDGDHH